MAQENEQQQVTRHEHDYMRNRDQSTLVEVIDRILDKGLVIDAWVNVSVIGIQLITVEARIVVASIETYVKYADILAHVGPVAVGTRKGEKGIDQLTESVGKIPIEQKGRQFAQGVKSAAEKTKQKLEEADIL